MWPPNAGSSVSVEKLHSATVSSRLRWAQAGPDTAAPARIKVNRDTATPRLNRLMNDPSVLGFRMRATGAPLDLHLEDGRTASARAPAGRTLAPSGGSVNHVGEDLDDSRLVHLHRQAQAPLESERGRESHGQRLHERGLQQHESEGVLREEAQVASGRIGYVGDVDPVDVEDHEGQVVRPPLLGDGRAEEDAGSLQIDEQEAAGRSRGLEPLGSPRIAYTRRACPRPRLHHQGT